MQPGWCRLCAGVLPLALAWPAGPATAAGPPDAISRTAAACTVGELAPPSNSVNLLDLQGFTVYQRLDPAQCTACPTGSLTPTQVRWGFGYYSTLCPLTFEVSVVASDQASCPAPDTANVICPPFTFVYAATDGPPHVATIPFPGGCCITAPVFLKVRIVDTGGCGRGTVGFFAHGPCTGPCRSYATFPGAPLEDSCTLMGLSPTIAADADCCTATPSLRPSWGGVKLRYR